MKWEEKEMAPPQKKKKREAEAGDQSREHSVIKTPRGEGESGGLCLRLRGAQVRAQAHPRGLPTRRPLEVRREQLHGAGWRETAEGCGEDGR